MNPLESIERQGLRRDLPPFRPGDTVRVHVNVREGEKERIQVFEGVVLRRRGRGRSATFTVRKVSYGVGVERVFPIESPIVTKLEIKSRGHVRRSRLYFLRERSGKKARLRSKLRDLAALAVPEEGAPEEPAPEDVLPAEPEEGEAAAEAPAAEATESEEPAKAEEKTG